MFWRLTLADTQGDWVRALRGRESQLRKIWAGIPNSLLANEVSRHRYWEGVEHQWTAIERKAGIRGRGEEKTDCGTRDSWKRVGHLVPSFLQVFFSVNPFSLLSTSVACILSYFILFHGLLVLFSFLSLFLDWFCFYSIFIAMLFINFFSCSV